MSTLIVAQAVDPAAGLTNRADFFAIATGMVEIETRKFYLLDIYKDRHPQEEQPHIVLREYQKWATPPHGATFYRVGIETVLQQTYLFRHLLEDGLVPIKEVARRAHIGSAGMAKYLRLAGLAGRYERGQIIHPGEGGREASGGRPDTTVTWLADFEAELCKIGFNPDGTPKHAHDDAADAWATCVEMMGAFLLANSEPQEPTYTPVTFGRR